MLSVKIKARTRRHDICNRFRCLFGLSFQTFNVCIHFQSSHRMSTWCQICGHEPTRTHALTLCLACIRSTIRQRTHPTQCNRENVVPQHVRNGSNPACAIATSSNARSRKVCHQLCAFPFSSSSTLKQSTPFEHMPGHGRSTPSIPSPNLYQR